MADGALRLEKVPVHSATAAGKYSTAAMIATIDTRFDLRTSRTRAITLSASPMKISTSVVIPRAVTLAGLRVESGKRRQENVDDDVDDKRGPEGSFRVCESHDRSLSRPSRMRSRPNSNSLA